MEGGGRKLSQTLRGLHDEFRACSGLGEDVDLKPDRGVARSVGVGQRGEVGPEVDREDAIAGDGFHGAAAHCHHGADRSCC